MPTDDCASITHLAGVCIRVGTFAVQRCSICGAALVDNRGQAAPANPDGSVDPTPAWECGRLVRVWAGSPTRSTVLPDTDKLPPDSCINLI